MELLGEKCVGIDVNSMKPLDNLGHPISIIRDAEELAAEAFGAAACLFNDWRDNLIRANHDSFHL